MKIELTDKEVLAIRACQFALRRSEDLYDEVFETWTYDLKDLVSMPFREAIDTVYDLLDRIETEKEPPS